MFRIMANMYLHWDADGFHDQLRQQIENMGQWIQNMNNVIFYPANQVINYIDNQRLPVAQHEHYIPQQEHHVHHQRPTSFRRRKSKNSRRNTHYDHRKSRSEVRGEHVKNEVDIQENNDENEGELVFNVDAILAFRATKEESEKEEDAISEESFELVDAVLDENFEFVELDDAGQLQKIYGRPSAPDAEGDVEYDREARILMFGDRADRIAGLETSLEISFDHVNDLHQPVVFPLE